MNKLQKRIASALAAGSLLLNVAGPALATTTITLSGNGVDSNNTADVQLVQTQTVVQSNNADVDNNVRAGANTGGNEANKNNGGNVEIDTGDSSVDVDVETSVNSNQAELDCCGNQDVEVKVANNAADTQNTVNLGLENTTQVFQTNKADIDNDVETWADSGNNEANKNNGGDVTVETGNASVTVDISNSANSNSAQIGGGADGGSSLSAWIVGNAAESKNKMNLGVAHLTTIAQDNDADVDNNVKASAATGNNEANKNNGGDLSIDTGDADIDVVVDNAVNMNWADVSCDCLLSDLWAKISDNAYDSDNTLNLKLADDLEVFQDNCGKSVQEQSFRGGRYHRDCEVDNDIAAWADTGENEANKNNGTHDNDPSIETGDASSDVTVETSGNANVFGDAPDWDFDLGGVNLNISLDLGALLAGLLG